MTLKNILQIKTRPEWALRTLFKDSQLLTL